MADRYPHAYAFDGPSGGAGSGRCGYCGVSDEDESADMECSVRLRQALERAQDRVLDLERRYCNHNVTAILTADGNNRLEHHERLV